MAKARAFQAQSISQVGFSQSFDPAGSDRDRALFEKVCDAIGATAQYIQRDVMGDIGTKLVDEMWFGAARSASPTPSFGQGPSPQSQNTPSIHASMGHGFAVSAGEIDLDHER